jgi:16S rRNA (adenine1518-N6/adenine1519-N6)-dimethyltransferase
MSMKPKKHLGQHFLTATSFANKIAAAVPAGSLDNLLEIGPGRGALSQFLLKRFPAMHCVEFDRDVIGDLTQKLGSGQWVLHREDVLKFDFSKAGFPLHVVGNLPYSIGAMIIKKTLLYGENILSCTFMVQREVAQRIAAKPSTRQNGFLAVFCQFFGTVKVLFHVPPGAFFPKPKVDSTVVQIKVERSLFERLPAARWLDFFSFVDKGFAMRRKMLVNSLGREEGKKTVSDALLSLNVNPMVRAEDLGCAEWIELFRRTGQRN